MEKLYQIIKQTSILLLLFSTTSLVAQNNFYVYKYAGEPYVLTNDSVKSVSKGIDIDKKSKLVINNKDSVLYINREGQLFDLNKPGEYSYKQLSKMSPKEDTNSFAKKMFTYMWKEFTNTIDEKKNNAGVVYRGDGVVLMKHPADSVRIFHPEVIFQWNEIKSKAKDYYFILRDVKTGTITKIGVFANSLTLFVDGTILTPGNDYEWAIVETKYLNLNKITLYKFHIATPEEFKKLKVEIDQLTSYLKGLGLSKQEAKKSICEDYKICY